MKVKDSNVYSVQKHRADKRGSHRDIRIGLDSTVLSFGLLEGDLEGRLPKRKSARVSVLFVRKTIRLITGGLRVKYRRIVMVQDCLARDLWDSAHHRMETRRGKLKGK